MIQAGSVAEADPTEQFFLGVDGGGSKTLAVIVDERGTERGRGLAGGTNYKAIGLPAALAHVHEAVNRAALASGCQLPLTAARIGLAGVDSDADRDLFLAEIHALAATIHLTNDAELLLSALDQGVGVALIAGTGAIALGRDACGQSKRSSGWGHLLGDEGSGYYIGQKALQAAVRAADGRGKPTLLLEGIMRHWKLHSPDDLVVHLYRQTDKAEIARLSALVFAVARAGDAKAQRIIQGAARELALAALTVGAALDFPHQSLPLALGGGLMLGDVEYREATVNYIQRQRTIGELALVAEPASSAARAAVQLATGRSFPEAPAQVSEGRISS